MLKNLIESKDLRLLIGHEIELILFFDVIDEALNEILVRKRLDKTVTN